MVKSFLLEADDHHLQYDIIQKNLETYNYILCGIILSEKEDKKKESSCLLLNHLTKNNPSKTAIKPLQMDSARYYCYSSYDL